MAPHMFNIVRGGATVILAMGDGKRAATAIDRYLKRMLFQFQIKDETKAARIEATKAYT